MSFNRATEGVMEEGLRILIRDLSGLKQQNLKDKNELVLLKNLEARILESSKMGKICRDAINRRADELLASQEQIEQTMQKAIDQALKLLTDEKYKLNSATRVTDEINSLRNAYLSYLESLDKLTSEPRPSLDSLTSAHSQIKREIVAAKKLVKSLEGVKCFKALEETMTVLESCAEEMQSYINSFDNLFRKLIDNQQAFKDQQHNLTVLLMIEKNKFKNDDDIFNDSEEGIEYQQNPMNININRTPSKPIPSRIASRTQTPGSNSSGSGNDSPPSREEKIGSEVKPNLINNSIFADSNAGHKNKVSQVAAFKNQSSSIASNRYKLEVTPDTNQKGFSLSLDEIDPTLTENQRRRLAIQTIEKYLEGNPGNPPHITGKDVIALYIKAYMDAMCKLAKHEDDKRKYTRRRKEFSPELKKPVEAEVKKMMKFLEQNSAEFLTVLKSPEKQSCCIM